MSLAYQIMQVAGRIVQYARGAGNRRGAGDKWIGAGFVQGPEPDPELGEEQITLPVRFIQWFGFRSAPPTQGTECAIATSRGGSSNRLCVGADNLQHGPLDLKDGESAVYNAKSGTRLKLAIDGTVSIDAATPTDVVVNGGTLPVARQNDNTADGFLSLTVSGVAPAAQTVALVYVNQSGAPLPLIIFKVTAGLVTIDNPATSVMNPVLTNTAPILGKIVSGAPRFKA